MLHRRLGKCSGRFGAHAAADGVLSPAHHVVQDVVDRLLRTLHAFVRCHAQRVDNLFGALASFNLIFAEERNVCSRIQQQLSLFARVQAALDHGIQHMLARTIPSLDSLFELRIDLKHLHANGNLMGIHVAGVFLLALQGRSFRLGFCRFYLSIKISIASI